MDQNITLTANASDSDGTIAVLNFFANGNLIASLTDGTNSMTTSFANAGTYNITVEATDNDGASTISDSSSITINEVTLPVLYFQSPVAGQFTEGDDLGVVVTVGQASVANIRLFIDNTFVRQENVAPYEWGTAHNSIQDPAILNLAAGTHVLKAVGTTTNGEIVTITKTITVIKKALVPTEFVINNIHDAYLQHTNRFNSSIIRVEKGRRTGYLMFDLSEINGAITTAMLEFQVSGDSGNGTLLIHEGTHSNWTETNLSMQNRPGIKTQAIGSRTGALQIGSIIRIPIDLSRGTDDTLSLIVEMNNGNDFAFGSKENSTTIPPRLVINYNESVGAKRVIETSNKFAIYPNPVQHTLFISGNIDSYRIVEIYNSLGALQISQQLDKGSDKINTSNLKSGFYFVNIISLNDNGPHVKHTSSFIKN